MQPENIKRIIFDSTSTVTEIETYINYIRATKPASIFNMIHIDQQDIRTWLMCCIQEYIANSLACALKRSVNSDYLYNWAVEKYHMLTDMQVTDIINLIEHIPSLVDANNNLSLRLPSNSFDVWSIEDHQFEIHLVYLGDYRILEWEQMQNGTNESQPSVLPGFNIGI